MSASCTRAAWRASVTDTAKVGLLALADSIGGEPDETSVFDFEHLLTIKRLTGWTDEQVDGFIVALGLAEEGAMGGGTWMVFDELVTAAEGVWAR